MGQQLRGIVSILGILLSISALQSHLGGTVSALTHLPQPGTYPAGALFCRGSCGGRQRFEGILSPSGPQVGGYERPVRPVPHNVIYNNRNCNPFTTRGCLTIHYPA